MSFLKKLFAKAPSGEAMPSADQMPIADVWEEFVRIVPGGNGKMIDQLETPGYRNAYEWLKPPSECPMAKSFLRAMVNYYRDPNGDFDELSLVYQAESPEKWSTPSEASILGIRDLVALMNVKFQVFYKETPESEWGKMLITPQS